MFGRMFGLMVVLVASGCGKTAPTAAPTLAADDSTIAETTVAVTNRAEAYTFLALINQLRAEKGLSVLKLDTRLSQASKRHSDFMNRFDVLTHAEPFPNFHSSTRIRRSGGDFNFTGENIACGNSDARATFLQWKNSPSHYAAMTDPDFEYIGIARSGDDAQASENNCPWYWTTNFGGY